MPRKIYITYKILFTVSRGSWISHYHPAKKIPGIDRDKKTSSYFCPFLVMLTVVCQLHHHFSPEILQCYFAYSKVCFGGISGYFFRVVCCKENGEIRRGHILKEIKRGNFAIV